MGLGYVGLPLAVHLARQFSTIGFDIDERRIQQLRNGHDETDEIQAHDLDSLDLELTSDPTRLSAAKFIIVAVPTPVDDYKRPNFKPLIDASHTISRQLTAGSVVVYESTVYPGATEEICVPALSKHTELKRGQDFFVGYSPERINPGDKEHTLDRIVKVVAGESPEVCDLLKAIYGQVVPAGIHQAPSIATAEAAKVIENTQRDLNIALMNELAIIFGRLGIDTKAVLDAAGTKWNFLKFTPGLVGGHCIGVDPYYLTHAAERAGYLPEVILAGRRINDGMSRYIAEQTVKQLIRVGKRVSSCHVLILGATFKENVPDLRNSKVLDVFHELKDYGMTVDVYDPVAQDEQISSSFKMEPCGNLKALKVDAIVLAVPHKELIDQGIEWMRQLAGDNPVFMDVKSAVDPASAKANGFTYWRL